MIGELLELLRIDARRRWPRERLLALRDARLHDLVRRSWHDVPAVRAALDAAGVGPDDVRTASDLARLPLTTKDALRVAGRNALARWADPAACASHCTSGSSGEPLVTYATPLEERTRNLVRLRALLAMGFRPRDRLVVLGPAEAHRRRPHERLGLFWCDNVSLLLSIDDQIRCLRAWAPTILWVYPTVLRALLDRLDGRLSRVCRPRLVISSAEVLDDVLRRALTDDLGVDIRQYYAATEVGGIAWQCAAGSALHVNEDEIVLECLGPDGAPAADGEPGFVAVTPLAVRAMPLLRYRLEDRLVRVAGDCACGLPFARIAPPLGRENEVVRLPSGRTISPLGFGYLLEDLPDLRQWRVRQTSVERIVLQLRFGAEPDAQALARTRERVTGYLGEDVRVDVERCDFADERRRKFRVFVSDLPVARPAASDG